MFFLRRMRASRPDLDITRPIFTAYVVRIIAAAGISLTSVAGSLRGGDEHKFLLDARDIAQTPFSSGRFADAFTKDLHEWVLAIQLKAYHAPELALRVTQVAVATLGILALVAAVHELAGPRAARIGAWALAFEPAGMFFTGLLHKEANLFLAEGLVAYGGAVVWRRGRLSGLVAMVAGC